MNAVILARVSTKEQEEEGHSIEAQIDRLQEYAKRRSLNVLKVFRIIESSTRGDRIEFHQMIEFAESQQEVVAIVCDAVDRFQRSFKETVLLEKRRLEGKLELHFNKENLVISKDSNSSQMLVWHMHTLLSTAYTNAISDNVKRSINYKISNGEWIGKAPIGYRNEQDPVSHKKKITIDTEKAFLIKRLFEEYSQGGRSVREMINVVYSWGLSGKDGKRLGVSHIHFLLTNPFYRGLMIVKKQLHPGVHPPIISNELFERVQEIRKGWKKKQFKYSEKPFIFRGLIKCAHCGCTITSDVKKKKYVYLSCTKSKGPCEGERVREEDALLLVKEVFQSFQIPQDVLEAVKEGLKQSNAAKNEFHKQALARVQRDYNQSQKRIENLMKMRLDESITKDEYDKMHAELKQHQHELNSELRMHTNADETFNITVSTLLDLASRAGQLFESSKAEQKRALLNLVLSNFYLRGKTLEYTVKKPFSLFMNKNCTEMLPEQDSNLRPGD